MTHDNRGVENLQEREKYLEARIETLEKEISRLKQVLESSNIPDKCQCSECRDIVRSFFS